MKTQFITITLRSLSGDLPQAFIYYKTSMKQHVQAAMIPNVYVYLAG